MYHLTHDTKITISVRLAWAIALAILAGVMYSAVQIGSLQGKFSGVEHNREDIKEIGVKIENHESRLLKLEINVNP